MARGTNARLRFLGLGMVLSGCLLAAACGSAGAAPQGRPAASASAGGASGQHASGSAVRGGGNPAQPGAGAAGGSGGPRGPRRSGTGQGSGTGQRRAGRVFGLAAAAQYLGLDSATLRKDLQAGQSLAQIAQAQGKDAQGLEQAMVNAAKSRLDQAVAAGRISPAQETQALQNLTRRVAALVNHAGPYSPRGRRGAPGGYGAAQGGSSGGGSPASGATQAG